MGWKQDRWKKPFVEAWRRAHACTRPLGVRPSWSSGSISKAWCWRWASASGIRRFPGHVWRESCPFWPAAAGVEIGTTYDVQGRPGTLDVYLKNHVKRATAGWVAALLEAARVVEIDRSRPAKVRLLSMPTAWAASSTR